MKLSRIVLTLFFLLSPLNWISAHPAGQVRKPLTTFAFFGCNRIDQKDYEATQDVNPSSANLPQLKQNLKDIATLNPDLLFFGGDLVMGYADDNGEKLQIQLTAWISMVRRAPKSPECQYVAISGNHELNRRVGEKKLPNLATDAIWTKFVATEKLVPANLNGPTPATDPLDKLVSDQRALSYSFNRSGVHFVVLNTDTRVSIIDPKTGESEIGMVPIRWLRADLDAAEQSKSIVAVVVMGHRNLIEPRSAHGDAPVNPLVSTEMTNILIAHKKVRAYVCAHVHAFDITSFGANGPVQATFGNGGSKLEKDWTRPGGRSFGFGLFRAYSDGSLGITAYHRPEPKDYLDARPSKTPQASPDPEVLIQPR